MYLHLRPRPMGRTDAPPCLPGASHLYGEEAKELALAPVGLARHRTKWPCDQVGPPSCVDPPDHLQPVTGPPWTQEANGGQNIRPLGGLISWLLFARDINNRSRAVDCIFVTAATSVYFKVIFAQLSPVAIFPVLPRATKGLAIQFLGVRQRFSYICSYCQEERLSDILYASQWWPTSR
jgi:hypothetical protein